jgi:hypothetical protein
MAELIAGNFVQITIDGTDRTQYVIGYRRYSSLCEIGDSFEIVLSPDYPTTLDPYDSIVITEWYDGSSDVVLRGYLLEISQDFNGTHSILGQDKSVLLFDHFISDQVVSTGESVDFWIQYYADQVGLDIEFQASSDNVVVEPDTFMGMQSAGDGILALERLAAYFVRFDSDADKLIAYRLGSSEPAITINEVVDGKRHLGTEKTRNKVKVYGGYRYSLDPDDPPELLISEASSVIPELIVDKTVVIANPVLRKQLYLDIVANRILSTVNSVDDLQYYSIPALIPNLEVGQVAYVNISYTPQINYSGDREITSIETTVDENGAITIIGVGEKCARLSIEFPTPPVYATTTDDGVAVSWNAGNSFTPSNTGLTGSGLIGQNIGVNSNGRQMVLTAAGIFRRNSSVESWTFVDDTSTLPDPINDSNDQPSGVAATNLDLIRIVDEPTNPNTFHIMANGISTSGSKNRSWIYTTEDFGSSWNSTQLYVTAESGGYQDHEFAPSGIEYNVYGHDLFGGIDNNVFALVTSTAELFIELFLPLEVYFSAVNTTGSNRGWAGLYDGSGIPYNTVTHDVTSGDFVGDSRIFSLPDNRDIAYWVIKSVHLPSTEKAWYVSVLRTKDGGDNWDILIDEVLWYTGDFSGPSGNDNNDYPGFVMFDYASTSENFNFTITACTHDTTTGTAIFRGFFFNDNSVTDVQNYSIDSNSVSLALVSDQGVFSMNHNDSAAHSTNLNGTNYGYNALFTTEPHQTDPPGPDPPFFTDIDVKMSVQKYNMTTQTITEVASINNNYLMGPDASWATLVDGGVFSANGETPYWFWSYRERISDPSDYDRHYFYMGGSNTILQLGEGEFIFIPIGVPYSSGNAGAIALDGFSKTFYTSGARIDNTTPYGTNIVENNQGSLATSNWYMPPNFTLVEQTDNVTDGETYWSDSYFNLRAQDFAWKDFID